MSLLCRRALLLVMLLGMVISTLPCGPAFAVDSPFTFTYNDGDADGVYFSGNPFSVTVGGFPYSNVPTVRLVVGVFSSLSGGDFSKKVLSELSGTSGNYYMDVPVTAGRFTLAGTVIGNDLNTGTIGFKILNAATSQELIPGMSIGDMAWAPIVGMRVPAGDIVVTPALAAIPNLRSCPEIAFLKVGYGSIIFPAGLDLFSNRDQLAQLQTGVDINFDMGTHTLTAKIDTGSLTFLQSRGATIEFPNGFGRIGLQGATSENFRDFIMLSVMQNNGIQVPTDQLSGFVDTSLMTYDANIDKLRIPVKHFTRFNVTAAQTTALALSALPNNTIIFGNKAFDLSLLNDATMTTEILTAFIANSNHFTYKMVTGGLINEMAATQNAATLVPLTYKGADKVAKTYQ